MRKFILTLNKLVPTNKFTRNVGVLVGGTAGAQAIMLALAPILTRIYSPSDFGIVSIFTSLLAFFSIIACMRYELAIPLPETEDEAANLTILSLILVIISSIILIALVALLGDGISTKLGSPILAGYLWLLPVGVFLSGIYQAGEKWAIRVKAFKTIAGTKFTQALTSVSIQLISFNLGALGLILGQMAGQSMGGFRLTMRALRANSFRNINIKTLRAVATKYRHFPLYSSWTALSNTASLQLAPLVFITLFGSITTGLYALSLRMLMMPASLIGVAVSNAFLAHAPEANRNGTLGKFVQNLHEKLVLLGLPALFFILIYGPDLFELVFGEQWRKAGEYARWMAPWIYLQFQWSPLSSLSTVLELQREALISQILTLSLRVLVLVACGLWISESDITILLFSIVSALAYQARIFWFLGRAGISPKNILGKEARLLCVFSILALPAYLTVDSEFTSLKLIGLIYFVIASLIFLIPTHTITNKFLPHIEKNFIKKRYIYSYQTSSILDSESINIYHTSDFLCLLNSFDVTTRLKSLLQQRALSSNWILFAYIDNNKIAGYSFLHCPSSIEWNDSLPTHPNEARTSSSYIEPYARGQGIRGNIIAAQHKYCLENNKHMWSVIEATNNSSIRSTEKSGAIRLHSNFLIKFFGKNIFTATTSPFSWNLLIGSKRAQR